MIPRNHLATAVSLAALVAIVLLPGCSSSNATESPERPGAPGNFYGSGQPDEKATGTWIPTVGMRNQKGNLGDEYGRKPPPPPEPKPAPAPAPAPAPRPAPMVDATRCTMAFPTGDRATSVILLETMVPAEVTSGVPFDYEMRVTNLTQMTVEDVVVTDTLQGEFNMTGSTPAAGGGAGGTANWNLGRLNPGETKAIKVTGTATGNAGAITRCAKVAYNSQCCVTTRVVRPALALRKAAPAEVLACENIELTFNVTNSGTGPARNVRIDDQLPQGWTTTDGQTRIGIDAGTLDGGQSREFKVVVRSAGPGRFENRAKATAAGGLETDSNTTNTVVKQPVLVITKNAPERRFLGREIDYEITVTNRGDGVARDTILEDTIAAGNRFVRASDGGADAGGGKITWRLGNLEPNATRKVTMTIAAGTEGRLRNTATTRAFCAQAVTAEAFTVVEGIPAILLEVVDTEDPVELGKTTTYVIDVTNQGSAVGTQIVISGALEPSMEFVSGSGATALSGPGGASFSFAPLAQLGAKQKATWRVVVKAVKAGDVRFRLAMKSAEIERPVEETEATRFY